MTLLRSRLLVPSLLVLAPALVWASEEGGAADPVAPVALSLAVVLVAAKLGGDLAVRVGQPSVLGELVAGAVLGNLSLVGFGGLEYLETDTAVDMLARLGVLILLFEVGLESTVGQLLKVGLPSLIVALLGVVAPFGLGWLVSSWLMPDHSVYVHAFIGATLCATSVGITARVLKDLHRSQTNEARIILGAAVIDDVLGLIILSVVSSVVVAADTGGTLALSDVGLTIGKAVVFLVGSLALGVAFSRRFFVLASRLQVRGVLLAVGLAFCFFMSWAANAIGLAPIVGAFAAGLILEDTQYKSLTDRGEHQLEELIQPIAGFLVPVFFVVMGTRTDLRTFADPAVLGLASALVVVAIVGKMACSLGVGGGLDRISIGIGMIPRGEVSLIFANIGAVLTLGGEPVIDAATFSAIVVMVVVTTMLAPPALKWSLGRHR